jgi:hypothetical protein
VDGTSVTADGLQTADVAAGRGAMMLCARAAQVCLQGHSFAIVGMAGTDGCASAEHTNCQVYC